MPLNKLQESEMKYGVIYLKIVPPNGHKSEWIKYLYLFQFAPESIQQNIIHIANDINTKYVDDIVIPMDIMLHPGCTTKPEKVEEIATDMYNQFLELTDRQGFPGSIRCAYSVGELSDVNVATTHKLGYDDVMLKVGRFIDESNETGIFKV